jgi:upstream activation factor subunit UAF30
LCVWFCVFVCGFMILTCFVQKDINEIILERYYDLVDRRKDEEYDAKERLKQIEKQDALLAARLSKSTGQGPLVRARKASNKKTKKTSDNDKKVPSNTGFNRELILSDELSSVLGTSRLSRPQVVKQLWAYIKDNHLQNPDDKRQILCNEKLQVIFKKSMYCLNYQVDLVLTV